MSEPLLYRWISALPPPSLELLQQRWSAAESRGPNSEGEIDLNWAVRRSSDGCYIGKLDAEVARNNVATNVGYIVFLPFWNQGYATEALRALASHLERQGVVEQRALVTLGNDASARVLTKAGFVRTRVIADNDTIRRAILVQACRCASEPRRRSEANCSATVLAGGRSAVQRSRGRDRT